MRIEASQPDESTSLPPLYWQRLPAHGPRAHCRLSHRSASGPMMLRWLRDRARTRRIGRALYDSIVAQSRAEAFYRALRVPDTVEGRFELVVLHMHLVLER